MRAGLALAGTLAILTLALGATACGGSEAARRQEAAQARADTHWRAGLKEWRKDMLGALDGISLLFSTPGPVELLQKADPATSATLERFEHTLAACSTRIASLGPVPAGLAAAHIYALRACDSLESGAQLIATGVNGLRHGRGIGFFNRATTPLGDGQGDLNVATAALRATSP